MNILRSPSRSPRRSPSAAPGGIMTVAVVALVACLVASPAALAQSGSSPALRPLVEDPGYVDLDLGGFTGRSEPTIEVNLGGALLALLSESMRGEDDDFAQLLTGLRSIRVEIYDLDEASAASVGSQIRQLSNGLTAKGWEPVVRVRDEEEQVHILVRTSGNAIAGLTALFSQAGESVGFINIVGSFDPARLGRLARQLDLKPLAALGNPSADSSAPTEKTPDAAPTTTTTENQVQEKTP